jgi:hypothetical protein
MKEDLERRVMIHITTYPSSKGYNIPFAYPVGNNDFNSPYYHRKWKVRNSRMHEFKYTDYFLKIETPINNRYHIMGSYATACQIACLLHSFSSTFYTYVFEAVLERKVQFLHLWRMSNIYTSPWRHHQNVPKNKSIVITISFQNLWLRVGSQIT